MYDRRSLWILAKKDINDQTIDLKQFCTDETLEICAVHMKLKSTKIILGCIYRAPSGNMCEFLDILDDGFGYVYHPLTELTICADININYLTENENQTKLDTVMNAYSLKKVIYFPQEYLKIIFFYIWKI
jgi:hypothetical protein